MIILQGNGSRERARSMALRICEQLATIEVSGHPRRTAVPDGGLRVEVSIGIASARPGDDLDELLDRADAEMYREKARRRSAGTGID